MARASLQKWLTPILPYLAVGIGLFGFQNAWATLLGFHCAILLSLLLVRSQLPVDILFKSNSVRWILLSILVSGSSGVFLYLFWPCFGIASDLSAHMEALGLSSSNWPGFIGYFSLVNPFVEEYFWRAYLGNSTKKLHVSDLIYAGFHALVLMGSVEVGSIIYSLAVLVLAGWFWRQSARENNGLLAAVLGHMAADFTILVAVYWRA